MKIRTVSIPLMLAVLALGLSVPAHAQISIAGGLNFENFNDIDAGNARATFESASGYHVGLNINVGAGPISIRPGVYYRDLGDVDVEFGNLRGSFDLNMIEVPVDLRLKLGAAPVVTPYILGGPVFSFPTSGDDDFDESLEDLNISAALGAGLEVRKLFFELRYGFGVSRFIKDDATLLGRTLNAEDESRLNSVMLRIGINF